MPTPEMPGPLDPVLKVVGLDGVGDAAGATVNAIVAARRWMSDRHNWTRAGWWVSGSALIIVGALVLVRRPVAAGVGMAAPAGKASKLLKTVV